ncbi:MAG: response regulator transcription factor [Tomitella sp.]|nr:response regulator transcription factor [Tomitella sp.]
MISLVLVDDHAILRQGMRSILEREPDIEVVGQAASSVEARKVVSATRPDVAIVDLKLSAGSELEGLALCSTLSADHPGVGLLVLTTFLDEELVVQAMHAGARGYVVKDVDTTELVRAIRAVAAGESAFDARSAAAVVRSMSGRTAPRETITEREMEVLRLLAAGLSNRDIGERLYISATTAKFHVSNIMRKLQVAKRAEAVYAASKRGLI